MTTEIFTALFDRLDVFGGELILGDTTMHFQSASGSYQHHGIGAQTRFAALDIKELLGAKISAKSGFGDHVVGEFERGSGCDNRVATVCDIGKRTAVDKRRVIFQGLHQVRHEGVF